MTEKKRTKNPARRFIRSPWAIGVAIFVMGLAGAAYAANRVTTPPKGIIMQGVSIGPFSAGGQTADAVAKQLQEAATSYTLALTLAEGQETVHVGDKPRADAAPLALYDVDAAVKRALSIGRETNIVAAFISKTRAVTVGINLPFRPTSLDRDALRSGIDALLGTHDVAAENAHLDITLAGDGSADVQVVPERDGRRYDAETAYKTALRRIDAFSTEAVRPILENDAPTIRAKDVETVRLDIDAALRHAPLVLSAKGEQWTIGKSQLADWLDAVADEREKVRLGLDRTAVASFLQKKSESLATSPKDAIFEMKNGRVVNFSPSTDGETVDADAAVAAIESRVLENESGDLPIELAFTFVKPAVNTRSSNPYGIEEIIGVGETNFRGSPKNRRHNIGVGAGSVNGTIVPAGEEFSLLKTLGTIDGTTGYLQELVIKENRTLPEYGGGLCQIGSTTFRAVLASGLPVTVRQNHSYRVPYYERDGDGNFIGPGKDATIYDPAPDFRFVNDTGAGILILTKIKGDRLTFTFWGKKDGRTASQTASHVYNVVPPPEKKIVETTEIPPGTEKCTEHAHDGSDAVFSYAVTYATGEVKKKDFVSHYKPWQEVCLKGVDPSALPPADGAAVPIATSADAAGATGN